MFQRKNTPFFYLIATFPPLLMLPPLTMGSESHVWAGPNLRSKWVGRRVTLFDEFSYAFSNDSIFTAISPPLQSLVTILLFQEQMPGGTLRPPERPLAKQIGLTDVIEEEYSIIRYWTRNGLLNDGHFETAIFSEGLMGKEARGMIFIRIASVLASGVIDCLRSELEVLNKKYVHAWVWDNESPTLNRDQIQRIKNLALLNRTLDQKLVEVRPSERAALTEMSPLGKWVRLLELAVADHATRPLHLRRFFRRQVAPLLKKARDPLQKALVFLDDWLTIPVMRDNLSDASYAQHAVGLAGVTWLGAALLFAANGGHLRSRFVKDDRIDVVVDNHLLEIFLPWLKTLLQSNKPGQKRRAAFLTRLLQNGLVFYAPQGISGDHSKTNIEQYHLITQWDSHAILHHAVRLTGQIFPELWPEVPPNHVLVDHELYGTLQAHVIAAYREAHPESTMLLRHFLTGIGEADAFISGLLRAHGGLHKLILLTEIYNYWRGVALNETSSQLLVQST